MTRAALLAGAAAPRRTFQPCRAASFLEGDREHRIWRPLGRTKKEAWRFRDAIVAAAERYDDSTKVDKGRGARMGALGLSGIKVLKAVLSFTDLMTGRVEPAQATIAERARLSVRTVIRCLERLKEHGFIDWIHRVVALDNAGAGPQVQQIPNAYWFNLRGRALGLVKLLMRKWEVPPPDDDVDRRAQHREAVEAMLDRTSLEAVARYRAGDSPLGDALAALGRSLERSASDSMAENPGQQGEI